MKDKEFLHWLLERLVYVYGESPNVDFVHKLRGIINNYPEDKVSEPAFREENRKLRTEDEIVNIAREEEKKTHKIEEDWFITAYKAGYKKAKEE